MLPQEAASMRLHEKSGVAGIGNTAFTQRKRPGQQAGGIPPIGPHKPLVPLQAQAQENRRAELQHIFFGGHSAILHNIIRYSIRHPEADAGPHGEQAA